MKIIKVCPLCKGMNARVVTDSLDRGSQPNMFSVRCPCGCSTDSYISEELAIKTWNTRPIEEELKQRISELKEEIHKHVLIHATVNKEFDENYLNMIALQEENTELREKIKSALEVISQFGGTDGAHHKTWVLDQVVRGLTGDKYHEWVEDFQKGDEGSETYLWDEGIAP